MKRRNIFLVTLILFQPLKSFGALGDIATAPIISTAQLTEETQEEFETEEETEEEIVQNVIVNQSVIAEATTSDAGPAIISTDLADNFVEAEMEAQNNGGTLAGGTQTTLEATPSDTQVQTQIIPTTSQ